MMPEMNYSERIAKQVIEQVTGGTMHFNEQQSNGEWDFDLVYPDGRKAAVEVTTARQDQRQRFFSAQNKYGNFIPCKHCKNSWFVTPKANFKLKFFRQKGDEKFRELEKECTFQLLDSPFINNSDIAAAIIKDLKIDSAHVQKNIRPIGFRFAMPPKALGASEKEVFDEISMALKPKTSVKKLHCAKQNQDKHIFLLVDKYTSKSRYVLMESKPPSELFHDLNIIDHIWISTESFQENTIITWESATEDSTWQRHELQLSIKD